MFINTENKLIWKNGSFQKWDDTNVHILSHTLHYGTGVFEGVRAYDTLNGPAIFRLKEHTNRLFDAAKKINIFNLKFPIKVLFFFNLFNFSIPHCVLISFSNFMF